jgi:hypothetical protein
MVSKKPFAILEFVMGMTLILVSLLWCNFVPSADDTYLYFYIVMAISVIIMIIAVLRFATKG